MTYRYYANEREVGEAVRQSGLKRSEIFITTKVLTAAGSVDKTYRSVLDSVHKIDGENGYVDLFLIHTPSGGAKARKEMWQALEKLLEEGKTRAIGVSNWGIGHIEELKSFAKIYPPHVNQIEVFSWALSVLKMLIRDLLATSFLAAERDRRILPWEWHCRRSILSSGPEPQSQWSNPQVDRDSTRKDYKPYLDPLLLAEELGAVAKKWYPFTHCRECERLWLRVVRRGNETIRRPGPGKPRCYLWGSEEFPLTEIHAVYSTLVGFLLLCVFVEKSEELVDDVEFDTIKKYLIMQLQSIIEPHEIQSDTSKALTGGSSLTYTLRFVQTSYAL